MMRPVALTIALTALTTAAPAATFNFTVNPAQSSVSSSTTLNAPFAGTFKGNFDETTTPDGTQTRTGLFGGSGNNPISYTAAADAAGDSTTHPAGAFSLLVNTAALTVSMSGLTADLLNGDMPAFDITVNLEFSTFHTVNPSALYLGGAAIPIPLGSASLTTLSLSQDATADGVLVPDGVGGYTFTIIAPATITLEASLIGGQPFAPAPFSAPVTITGTLTVTGSNATVTLSADLAANQTVPGPFAGGAFTDIPLAIPTILPPGATANLLFSGELQSFSFDFNTAINLLANGAAANCPGDTNGDGVVNFADLNNVLGAFGFSIGQPQYSPGADLNNDGVVNFSDLNIVLSAFGTTC